MLMSPCIDIYLINAVNDPNSLYLSIDILHNKKDEMIETKTLLDCRVGGIFLDQNFAQKHNLRTMKLDNQSELKTWTEPTTSKEPYTSTQI